MSKINSGDWLSKLNPVSWKPKLNPGNWLSKLNPGNRVPKPNPGDGLPQLRPGNAIPQLAPGNGVPKPNPMSGMSKQVLGYMIADMAENHFNSAATVDSFDACGCLMAGVGVTQGQLQDRMTTENATVENPNVPGWIQEGSMFLGTSMFTGTGMNRLGYKFNENEWGQSPGGLVLQKSTMMTMDSNPGSGGPQLNPGNGGPQLNPGSGGQQLNPKNEEPKSNRRNWKRGGGFIGTAANIITMIGVGWDMVTDFVGTPHEQRAEVQPTPVDLFDPCKCTMNTANETREQLQQNMTVGSALHQSLPATMASTSEYAARLAAFDIAGGGHAEAMSAIIAAMNGDAEALKQNYSISTVLLEQYQIEATGKLAAITRQYDLFFQYFDNLLKVRETSLYGPYRSPMTQNQLPYPTGQGNGAVVNADGQVAFDICKNISPMSAQMPSAVPPSAGYSPRIPAPVSDNVSISEENLVMMRDMAEMNSVRSFVTMTPTVQVTTGNIMQEVDVNTMIAQIEAAMELEIAGSAERVFG